MRRAASGGFEEIGWADQEDYRRGKRAWRKFYREMRWVERQVGLSEG